MSSRLPWCAAVITPKNISTNPHPSVMIIEDLGLIPYREAWDLQKKYVAQLQEDPNADERILLVEHPAVYTLGFHGNADNMLASEQYLRNLGAECIRIERGGDITYHGPGQLVVYPIIDLRRHHLGVKQYIEILEHSVIELLAGYGIQATCNKDAIGVWIDWQGRQPRKICAIGVKVSHGVTMHGFALNVNTDLRAFTLINPCGFTDKGVTSLSQELAAPQDLNKLKNQISQILPTHLR